MTLLQKLEYETSFTETERVVADYILAHKDTIMDLSIRDLALVTYSSKATIARLCSKLGVNGFQELKIRLARELGRRTDSDKSVSFDYAVKMNDTIDDVARDIADLMQESIRVNYEAMDVRGIGKAADWILESSTVYYYALGDTLLTLMAFANRLGKLKIHTKLLNEHGEIELNIDNASREDLVILASYSGRYTLPEPYLATLRRKRCRVLVLSASQTMAGDLVLHIPPMESHDHKIATFYSQTSMQFLFNCIYSALLLKSKKH